MEFILKRRGNLQIEDILSDSYFPTMFGTAAISSITGVGLMSSAVLMRPDKARLFKPKNEDLYYNPDKLKTFGNQLKQ